MSEEEKVPIGTVRAAKDGSFLVFLRAAHPSGVVGHGYVVVGVHDPNHKAIQERVGPMAPGQERPLYAW